jgi:hypothetical protein
MAESLLNPTIKALIDDHLAGVPNSDADRKFLEEAAHEFYIATTAEATEAYQKYIGGQPVDPSFYRAFDDYFARIGFLRASNALARKNMGKPWRLARTMSS